MESVDGMGLRDFRETLVKAFPAPDLRCEATFAPANPCASAGGSEEAMISSALPQKVKKWGRDFLPCFVTIIDTLCGLGLLLLAGCRTQAEKPANTPTETAIEPQTATPVLTDR